MADAATFIAIFQTIIGVLGILGNGLVCVVIAKVPAMRTLTNAFIFNQAVIDFLASLMMILRNVKPPLHHDKVMAVIQCYFWDSPTIMFILFVTSTFNLVVLTAERYIAIVYPFKYLTYFGKKQAAIMLTGVWVVAIAYKIHVILFRTVVDGECTHASVPQAAYLARGFISFLMEYFIPLILMTFCYVHIILQLKKGASSIQAEPTTGQGENSMSGSLLRAKRNTLKTLFIVFMTYVICWSPNQISYFLFNFGVRWDTNGPFHVMSVALILLNSCVNPIIYAFKYKQFQKGFRQLLKPCFPKLAVGPDEPVTASTIVSQTRSAPTKSVPATKIETANNEP